MNHSPGHWGMGDGLIATKAARLRSGKMLFNDIGRGRGMSVRRPGLSSLVGRIVHRNHSPHPQLTSGRLMLDVVRVEHRISTGRRRDVELAFMD